VPVAIAPIDGQIDHLFESRDERPIVIVNRAAAAEVIVVFRYFQHPLARDVPSAQDIFEKRDYVFVLLRTPEGDHKQSVIAGHIPILVCASQMLYSLDNVKVGRPILAAAGFLPGVGALTLKKPPGKAAAGKIACPTIAPIMCVTHYTDYLWCPPPPPPECPPPLE
jgi:hypothetical protein